MASPFELSHIVRDKNFSFDELSILTDICFQCNNYLANFPQVFKEENRELLFLLKYEGNAVAFCSLYPMSFQLNGKRLSSYCIGSVCTHPNYRNLGLAKTVILLAEKKARENSADFIFLFSDNNQIYSSLNYTQVGKTYLAQITTQIFSHTSQKHLKEIQYKCKKIVHKNEIKITFKKNLLALNEAEKCKIWQFIITQAPTCEPILSFLEFCDILKIKNMNIYFATLENTLCAVCFYNKGDDFQNVIHSTYYSNRDALFLIINNIISNNKDKASLFFPGALYKDFIDVFDFQSIPSMSLKSLKEETLPNQILQNICLKNDIFVGSLQGT